MIYITSSDDIHWTRSGLGFEADASTTDTVKIAKVLGYNKKRQCVERYCVFDGGEMGSTGELGRMELPRSKLG